jgi:transcription-repair coupling factor (superfamily II helicase)
LEFLSLVKKSFPGQVPEGSRIYNLSGSSAALFLAAGDQPFVAVHQDEGKAETLRKDINYYRRLLLREEVRFLPDPNGAEASGKRALTMHTLRETDSVVTSSKNVSSNLWDAASLGKHLIDLEPGLSVSRSFLEDLLVDIGYRSVPVVAGKGEFSRKGWILDVFPTTSGDPLRIEFFGDEIERLRFFDVETQRSGAEVGEFLVYPALESEGLIELPRVMGGRKFFCLFPEESNDEVPEGAVYLSKYSFESGGQPAEGDDYGKPEVRAEVSVFSGLGILHGERKSISDLPGAVHRLSQRTRVVVVASSCGQAERLRDMFREEDLVVPIIDEKEITGYQGNISITVGELSAGVFLEGFAVLTERELFGERPQFRPIRQSRVAGLLNSVDDIIPGDYVVHREHGIGRFSGTVRQTISDAEVELMVLEYEAGRVYIPVQNIQNISKYRSEEGVVPKLDKLGGKTWHRKKERVRKRVQELASRLVSLYADRKVARGFVFSKDTELHHEFDSFFAYEETPDQIKAISDIKKDMESDKPMDRLICGDVGYGKTEVAMRAAFKAVYDGLQVAVLVPTTILAEQHYRTFRERFSGFPVSIDFISRFKTRKEIESALRALSRGETDILIGTHGLLSKRTVFSRLGLLVVDEEHRFGVAQKERIKEMSRNVDVLNLTATPIPRTLHMALSGIRDISVIETPPEERLSVKSTVTVFSEGLVKEVIAGELQRNGQVFFVHNRIHDIGRTASKVQELVPWAKTGIAHGQMPEKQLEEVMHRFFGGELEVLVSTAIIGSGLDIPRANTIIIDRADRMGLADLYQLRGRVGRGSVKGHAIFLAPPESMLTEEARKRLQAVQEMSYLGAGFRLALKDLEIRGAGDMFGPEQSGHIHEIGFDLYIEMLEKAVAELKGEDVKAAPEPAVDLKVSAFIPEEYIGDITLRLSFYRRMASLRREEEVLDFGAEMRDRFGPVPAEVSNLLEVMRLKIIARELSIMKIVETNGKVRVIFSEDTCVRPSRIFALHDRRQGMIRFLPDGFEVELDGKRPETAFPDIYSVLTELSDETAGDGTGDA